MRRWAAFAVLLLAATSAHALSGFDDGGGGAGGGGVDTSTAVFKSNDYDSNGIGARFTNTGSWDNGDRLSISYYATEVLGDVSPMGGILFGQRGNDGNERGFVRMRYGSSGNWINGVSAHNDSGIAPTVDFGSADSIDGGGLTATNPIIRSIGTGGPYTLFNSAGKMDVARINATGTPDGTTYLRGDGTWSTPAGGSGSSSLATTTGTGSGFGNVISSPTAVMLFNADYFGVTLQGSATAFVTITDIPNDVVDGNKLDLASAVDTSSEEYLVAWSTTTERGRPLAPITTFYFEQSREAPRLVFNATTNAFWVAASTDPYYGLMTFSHSTSSESNCGYFPMPTVRDYNTSIDMRLDQFSVLVGTGSDSGDQRYIVSVASKTTGKTWRTETYGSAVTVDMASSLGTVSGEERTLATAPTLTGWKSVVASGVPWAIQVCRDGNAAEDTSSTNSFFSMITVRAGNTIP